MQCVQSLTRLVKKLHELTFPAYGSIYSDNDFIDIAHRIPMIRTSSSNRTARRGTSLATQEINGSVAEVQQTRVLVRQLQHGIYYPLLSDITGQTFDEFLRGLVDAGVS